MSDDPVAQHGGAVAEPGDAWSLCPPDYADACVTNLVPALLTPGERTPSWLPEAALDADRIVLLVIDGLGWLQLEERRHLAPNLSALAGTAITTVAPSTTATALTSIATGLPPGEHGVVGYRIAVERDVLNVLRWAVDGRDARERIPPLQFQLHEPFCGQRPPAVTRAEFSSTAFSEAHLEGVRFRGYRMPSTLCAEIQLTQRQNEPFVYAYYDGIDKVAHEYGLGEHYDAELAFVDRMVGDLLASLPRGTALVITADHGQVDVGDNTIELAPEVMANCAMQSGEARFRWLHARDGRVDELFEATQAHHSDTGWVLTVGQTIEQGWWGPKVTDAARSRLGDVALVAREPVAYLDTADTGPFVLVGRHGSLTRAEMLVPVLVGIC